MADENFSHADAPRKSGSSVLIWVLGIGAVCLVVCCGGGIFAVMRFKDVVSNMATNDPAEIRKQTAEMIDISIPDKFRPMQGMNMVAIRMLMYQTDATASGGMGMLMLMEMPMQQMGVNAEEQEKELRKAAQQQNNQGFAESKSETREIEIRGEKVPFQFSEGTPSGQDKPTHRVSGVVRGKRGPVMIQFTLPDDQYDEDEVIQTLESIK